MLKEVKEGVMTMSHQIENINGVTEILKEPSGNYRIKSTITEMKNSLKGVNSSRFELARERIGKLEDRSINIMQTEQQREKEWRKMNTVSEKCRKPLSAPT